MRIETEVIEGFMGAEIPIVELDDGAVKFWIPIYEWKHALSVLNRAMEDFPEASDF